MNILGVILFSGFLYILGLCVFKVSYRYDRRTNFLTRVFSVTYWVKISVLLLLSRIIYANYETTALVKSDISKFAQVSQGLWEGSLSFRTLDIPGSGMYYLYLFFDSMLGLQIVFISVFLVLLSTFILIPIAKITYSLYGRREALICSWLVGFYPGFIALSIFPHRDVIVTLCSTFSVYLLYILYNKYRFKYIVYTSISFLLIFFFRPELLSLILLCFALFVSMNELRNINTIYVVRSLLASLSLLGIAYVVGAELLGLRSFYFLYPGYFQNVVEQGIHIRRLGVENPTGFGEWIVYSGPLTRLTLGSAAFLIKPFPPYNTLIPFTTLSSFLTPGALILLALYPFACIGVIQSVRDKSYNILFVVLFILSIIIVASLIYAAGQIRYRLQIIPFIMMLSSFGFFNYKKYVPLVLLYFFALMASIIAYIVV